MAATVAWSVQIGSSSDDLGDGADRGGAGSADIALSVFSGLGAGSEQRCGRVIADGGLECRWADSSFDQGQTQREKVVTVTSRPAGAQATQIAVSVGLVALKQRGGLIGHHLVVVAQLVIFIGMPDP